MKKTSFIKLFVLFIAAAISLCSCAQVTDAAQQIASAVVSSVNSEISNALSEGMDEFASGMAEITSALNEVSSDISSANMEIAEQFDSIAESISGEVSSGLSEAVDNIVSDKPETTVTAETDISEDTTSEPAVTTAVQESNAAASSGKITETTTSSQTTEEKAETVWYTFRNKARYDEHYEKHGAEFGKITKDEYLQKANDLINSTSDRVLHKYSDDGDYMYFDQDTGYFLVLSADGYIRTFFIPTAGIKYWNRQ